MTLFTDICVGSQSRKHPSPIRLPRAISEPCRPAAWCVRFSAISPGGVEANRAGHSAAIRQCKQSASDKAPTSFDLLVKLDALGNVNDVLADPETELAKCSANSLRAGKLGPPPHADYRVNIHLPFRK